MDTSSIYSKTSKGLIALKDSAAQLPALDAKVLDLVDGRSTVAQLMDKLGDADAAQQVPQALAALETQALIRSYQVGRQADRTAVPEISAVELSDAESLQAWTEAVQGWAEARRGASELKERHIYCPPITRLQPGRQTGADVKWLLLVEDDASNARVLEFLFKSEGFDVVTAADSATAIAALAKQPTPELALLNRDDFVLLRHFRTTPALSQVPVILATAAISEAYVMRGLKEGADAYLAKPFKWKILGDWLKEIL